MGADLFIGLMSGTSMDGIDAALMAFTENTQRVLGFVSTSWPGELGDRLRALSTPGDDEIERLGVLDGAVAEAFSSAVERLLADTGTPAEAVRAIGSHGQTIRHRPDASPPFSLQIGDPNRLAESTGITVVADFRRRDMAAGGQGAPLVPAYHAAWFRDPHENRVVLNIGGIANVTLLPASPGQPVTGFDTGPGNILLDRWIRQVKGLPFDQDGAWAASGSTDHEWLEQLLSDPYFHAPPPKSTGPEYFSPAWLQQHLPRSGIRPEDVQATLTALTARSIADGVLRGGTAFGRVIVCGGGAHNRTLMQRLQEALPDAAIGTSSSFGVGPDQMEAAAFAWLARQTLLGRPGNLPAVTGASHPVILGGIYPAG